MNLHCTTQRLKEQVLNVFEMWTFNTWNVSCFLFQVLSSSPFPTSLVGAAIAPVFQFFPSHPLASNIAYASEAGRPLLLRFPMPVPQPPPTTQAPPSLLASKGNKTNWSAGHNILTYSTTQCLFRCSSLLLYFLILMNIINVGIWTDFFARERSVSGSTICRPKWGRLQVVSELF